MSDRPPILLDYQNPRTLPPKKPVSAMARFSAGIGAAICYLEAFQRVLGERNVGILAIFLSSILAVTSGLLFFEIGGTIRVFYLHDYLVERDHRLTFGAGAGSLLLLALSGLILSWCNLEVGWIALIWPVLTGASNWLALRPESQSRTRRLP